MIILQVILFISVVGILHSYLFFPLLLKWKAQGKSPDDETYTKKSSLPSVSVIIAAYNEEAVIEEKVNSIYKNDYPADKIEVLIGSDNSTDDTNKICQRLAEKFSKLNFIPFKERKGKIQIINKLEKHATGDILIFTDANVIFDENTIFELVKYFKNDDIGLVDSQMINTGLKKEGISFQEKSYISREVYIKHREGLLWGSMMGPFGGCYAIRKELYRNVPVNYLVDDFFICMNALQQGKKCINNLKAKVYEDVSNNLGDEFRRKIRIATGDFQNLYHFRNMLIPPWKPVAFTFLSHKVLRWIGPFLIIIIIIALAVLMSHYLCYKILAFLAAFIFILPVFDHILKKFNNHNVILRFATHFLTMNLALFIGFIRILKGVKSNVWKPTKRHQ